MIMAIDLLIFGVLLISFIVNLLALAGFWITPGLRTTANRFTINLLLINLAGCLILAPTLFLQPKDKLNEIDFAKSNHHMHNHNHHHHYQQQQQQVYHYSQQPPEHYYHHKFAEIVNKTVAPLLKNAELNEALSSSGSIVQINESNIEPVNDEPHQSERKRQISVISNLNSKNVAANKPEVDQHRMINTVNTEKVRHTIKTHYKCNGSYCRELTFDESSDTLVITEIEHLQPETEQEQTTSRDHTSSITSINSTPTTVQWQTQVQIFVWSGSRRSWTVDMAAALSALAVLLVVGDTWCAVTDPLRYHSRISGVKCWILIALTWILGILFGLLSAFREFDLETMSPLTGKQKRFATDSSSATASSIDFDPSVDSIFGLTFACLYFILIILLPFGFVCGMYWRIFSEARENGLRMRQNGSSPLLQSALNLTHPSAAVNLHSSNSSRQYANNLQLCAHRSSLSSTTSTSSQCGGIVGGILHLHYDNNSINLLSKEQQHQHQLSTIDYRRDSATKVLLPTISDEGDKVEQRQQEYKQHHILLTIESASGDLQDKFSCNPVENQKTENTFPTDCLNSMRQVRSSPNIFEEFQQTNNTILPSSSHLQHLIIDDPSLGKKQLTPNSIPAVHLSHPTFFDENEDELDGINDDTDIEHHHHSLPHHGDAGGVGVQSLQVPNIHLNSPKTLRYMSSIRHRLSNASSLFKYREESRAARISILVVIMFLVSYLPYGILVLLQSRIQSANFPKSTELGIFMILLANLSSPIIFAYRNKRVRHGIRRLLNWNVFCCGRGQHVSWDSNHSTVYRYSGTGITGGASVVGYVGGGFKDNNKLHLKSTKINLQRNGKYKSIIRAYQKQRQHQQQNKMQPDEMKPTLKINNSCSTIINLALEANGNDEDHRQDENHRQKYRQTHLQSFSTDDEDIDLSGDALKYSKKSTDYVLEKPKSIQLLKEMPVKYKIYRLFLRNSSKNIFNNNFQFQSTAIKSSTTINKGRTDSGQIVSYIQDNKPAAV